VVVVLGVEAALDIESNHAEFKFRGMGQRLLAAIFCWVSQVVIHLLSGKLTGATPSIEMAVVGLDR